MKYIFLTTLFLISLNLTGQHIVSGVVRDADGETLVGAAILEKGTSNGAVSDTEGRYTINVSPDAILVVTYIGFLQQEVEVNNQTTFDFTLEVNIEGLAEVIVIGYGSQKKTDLTGSVATISNDRLESKPNANIEQALQGAVPGVNVTQNSGGAEQGDNNILIRGRNSITAGNGPLIVLDGVPYTGNLSDINTTDVKSMTVLRDASATAIYGSRGSNGVIIIETKKGQAGKTKIAYNGYYGRQRLTNLPDLYDGPGFAEFKSTRLEAAGRDPDEWLLPSEQEILDAGQGVDWLDLTTQVGRRQEHNVSVSGGTDDLNYYVSLGYHDAEGVTLNDLFERYSIRVNVSFNITENLKFGTATQLTRIDRSGNNPSFSSSRNGAFRMNPLTVAFDENGDPTVFPSPDDDPFLWNPLAPTLEVNDDINSKVFTTNYLEYSFPFLEGLSYKINTGIEYDERNIGSYEGRNTGGGAEEGGIAMTDLRKNENYLVENILNYTGSFGKHSVGFTGLYSIQVEKEFRSVTEASNFVSDALTYFQMNNAASAVANTTDFEKRQLISQMARVNYGYSDKYLLTFTVRRDGYSGFGANNEYGVFPSVALGWNISEESFYNSSVVNYAKLRTSYGVNGNQAVGPYDNLARLEARPFVIGSAGVPGFFVSDLANETLGWEETSTLNLGLDFGFLNNRFQLSVDAYLARTEDLLLDRIIPISNGDNRIVTNLGEVENRGLEIVTQGFIVNGKDFTWDFKGNMAFNRNEIIDLYGDGQDDVANDWFIGEPINVNYGFQFDGIWQEGDDIENSAEPEAQPGYIRVLDVANQLDENGETILAIDPENDRVIQGQLDPKMIFGLENTFTYKGLSLYVFLQGVTGVTKANPYRDVGVGGDVRNNWVAQEFWTPENPINDFHANDPEANNFEVQFYEDASFMRVKDVTLTYRFNDRLFGNTGIGGVQLYSTVRNLATITSYGALDPEFDDQFDIPLQREYILGLKFNIK
ncbi:MAG: TonB-dependent receptor [Bacteroidota bacterium]